MSKKNIAGRDFTDFFSPADTTSENIIITLCMYIVIAFNSNNIDLTANHTKLISVYDFLVVKHHHYNSITKKLPLQTVCNGSFFRKVNFSFSVSPINSNPHILYNRFMLSVLSPLLIRSAE